MILAVFWTNFVILGCFREKSKIPKNDCFEKVKIEEEKNFVLKIEQLVSNSIYVDP